MMFRMLNILRKRKLQLCLFLFLFCLYALTTAGHYASTMDSSAILTALSIVEDGNFDHEEEMTPEMRKGKDGKYYCFESLGSVLIPIPLILVSKVLGITERWPLWRVVLHTNPILTALSALIIFVIGRELKYSRKTSLLLSLIYGLGTMAWAHTRYLMPDPLASLVYLVTFLYLLRYKRTRRTRELLLTGVWAGLALHCRPDAFIFVLAICVGVLLLLWREWKETDRSLSVIARQAVIFVLPIFVFLCLWGYYNYHRFGSVLETGYTVSAEGGSGGEGERFGALSYVQRFVNVGETVKGFLGMWVIPNRSIFFVNPVLIFWLFALKPFWRKYRFEMTVYGIAFVLYVLLYSNRGAYGFAGSAAWGQRYFLPMIGFMTLSMGLFVEKVFGSARPKVKILFVSVLLLSICFQFIGASQNYQFFQLALEKQFGPEETRLMMTMDPQYSLLIGSLQMLQLGETDFMYHNFVRQEGRVHSWIGQGGVPVWVSILLPLLIMVVLISGYLLLKELVCLPAEGVTPKKEPERKKRKKRRSKKA